MISPDLQRDFAVDVVRQLQQAGYTALWAGGCVRDLLLDLAPQDYDVATNATPEQVQQLFGRRTLPIGASFGVILVRGSRGAGDVEVATFRTEGPYLDGRHPEHVAFSTPEEDALRRDFTINGMFYDPLAERVLDYVGGQEDLAKKIVRAIGDPHARFREDKLRMLRAVRIAARFDYELDDTTARAIREMATDILVVSQERIAQELKKMLVHARRVRAVELARELGLLRVILPELTPLIASVPDAPSVQDTSSSWQTTLRALDLLNAPEFELAFATLLSAAAAITSNDATASSPDEVAARTASEAARRLKLSNRELEHIAWLLAHRKALLVAPGLKLSQLKRLLAQPLISNLIALTRALRIAAREDIASVEFCEKFLRDMPPEEINPPPLLTGDDLIQHGLQPGAQFKHILETVRDAQLEGTIRTNDDALGLVDELLKGDRKP